MPDLETLQTATAPTIETAVDVVATIPAPRRPRRAGAAALVESVDAPALTADAEAAAREAALDAAITLAEQNVAMAEDAKAEESSWAIIQRIQELNKKRNLEGTLTAVEEQQRKDALAELYGRYKDMVHRFVYFRVSGNRVLAEDITSDTFERVIRRIDTFTWRGRDVGAWIVTIARNLVADHFKSGYSRLTVLTGDVLDVAPDVAAPLALNPAELVVQEVTNTMLRKAILQLIPDQQECIVLRFLKGFSVAETAAAMGRNTDATKALQYRATKALEGLMDGDFIRF